MFFSSVICLLVICSKLLSATLSRSDKVKVLEGPIEKNVFDRDLVVAEPLGKDIYLNHAGYSKNTGLRNFNGSVLGYVTPWNNHGYDIAKIFTRKFTHISPVWLQIRKRGSQSYHITGLQDVDSKWLKQLRKNNPDIQIHVRIIFEAFGLPDYKTLFNSKSDQEALAQTIIHSCSAHKFNGIVLELWNTLYYTNIPYETVVKFIKFLSKKLQEEHQELFLVIPPYRIGGIPFTQQNFDDLYDYVEGFSLTSYDFSSVEKPGPNSPLSWMKEVVLRLVPEDKGKRSKILLGLNFYGMSYTSSGGGPILGRDVVNILKSFRKKLSFDPSSGECYFEAKQESEKKLIFYPTLYSIQQRIQLANELGTGLTIWEIGQGLDYFYDLL